MWWWWCWWWRRRWRRWRVITRVMTFQLAGNISPRPSPRSQDSGVSVCVAKWTQGPGMVVAWTFMRQITHVQLRAPSRNALRNAHDLIDTNLSWFQGQSTSRSSQYLRHPFRWPPYEWVVLFFAFSVRLPANQLTRPCSLSMASFRATWTAAVSLHPHWACVGFGASTLGMVQFLIQLLDCSGQSLCSWRVCHRYYNRRARVPWKVLDKRLDIPPSAINYVIWDKRSKMEWWSLMVIDEDWWSLMTATAAEATAEWWNQWVMRTDRDWWWLMNTLAGSSPSFAS